ncbi:GNAT family N-acetyltransferase [Vagococcus fluvialis]|uniref:GNAT family N-acetyltransferase n=1 Tax=Vagococcus fluvialis TaxID=2738 RepID=A0A7X6D7C7_9ENTE|nr:GNAT family N-acetyltransferase [Vagococcus fluvialis]NKC67114.1 GNAT family N-acetyltransferase [Vagococcus fluvialis]
MSQYRLVKGIKEQEELRQSFNQLAEDTFEINFVEWYESGYWGKNYIPYSLVDGKKIIANASITKSKMMINNQSYETIQIGTVMTAENYRSKGLSKELITDIINDYKEKVDFIYLFANETVLDFYPKFGFKRIDELSIELKTESIEKKDGLEVVNFKEHQEKIEKMANNRNNSYLNSYLEDGYNLTMFYYGSVFKEGISYIKELDTYLCYEIENKECHLFDVLSDKEISMKEVLNYLFLEKNSRVYCHFDVKEESIVKIKETVPVDDDALFVLGVEEELFKSFKLPLFNHA